MTTKTLDKVIDRASELGAAEPIYYEVFARTDSRSALEHIGAVDAPNLELAKARAWFVYSERKWQEFCIVPTEAITSLTNINGRSRIKEV